MISDDDAEIILFLDMAKAYDRLEWNFLYVVLSRFGFSAQWINLVKGMLENCWVSVLFRGVISGFFKSSRGLRQGDPLAPSLFILAEEALSRGLCRLFASNKLMLYNSPRSCPRVSHLLFADDILFFTNGNKLSLRVLLAFLSSYERASGQLVNRLKSSFTCHPSVTEGRKQLIKMCTGFGEKRFPIKYLGVPIDFGRSNKQSKSSR